MSVPVPTARLAVVAALAGLVVLFAGDFGAVTVLGRSFDARFVAVNVVVAVLAVLDWSLAPAPRRLGVERTHPPSVVMDHTIGLTWTIERERVRGARATTVSLADDLPPSFQSATRRVEIPVPAAGSASASVDARPSRRGRFELGGITLRTRGPLGLVLRQQRRDVPSRLRVLPPFRSAKEAELILHRARVLDVGLRSAKGRGGGTEFDSLRELTPDDETRRIDWAATARSPHPIVRTFRAEENQTVIVALDAGRIMAGRVDGVPRLEFGMDGAMLLAELATGLGDRMGLMAFDRGVHTIVDPSNRRSQRSMVTEAVCGLHPALAESDYRSMVSHVLAHHRRRTLLVLVTELSEAVIEEFVLPSLPLLTRKHLVVVASVRDPDVTAWTTDTAPDADGAFLRSAALASIESRRRIAARLGAAGALVVDADPADFVTRLGDVYLDAKAIGRL